MVLVGRVEERGAVRTVLVAGSGTVAFVAPAGGGLTAVLDQAAEQAVDTGTAALRACGRAEERDITLALLRELAAADDTGALARLTADLNSSIESARDRNLLI